MKSVNIDRAIDVINRQVAMIEAEQLALMTPKGVLKKRGPMAVSKLTSQAMTMARGLSAWLCEQRKSAEEAEEQLEGLTPERIAALTLKLVTKLSPEHRAAVALHIHELDGKLIGHGGAS